MRFTLSMGVCQGAPPLPSFYISRERARARARIFLMILDCPCSSYGEIFERQVLVLFADGESGIDIHLMRPKLVSGANGSV